MNNNLPRDIWKAATSDKIRPNSLPLSNLIMNQKVNVKMLFQ